MISNANFIGMNEISSTKTKKNSVLYNFLCNKEVYNLMMTDMEAETCSC